MVLDTAFTINPFYVFNTHNKYYCYISKSGALTQIDKDLFVLLKKFVPEIGKKGKWFSNMRLSFSTEQIEELIQYDLISPTLDSEADEKNLSCPDYSQAPIVNITAILTSDCNLSCKYCYSKRNLSTSKYMSSEIGRQTVDFLIEASQDKSDIHITFFGGEPLLNFPVLRQMVEYGKEQAKRHKKSICFSLTTNGTLLEPEIAKFMDRHQLRVTVSIDGSQQSHDQQRPQKNHQGSYDLLAEKLAGLPEYCQSELLSARVTVSNKNLGLFEIFNQVQSTGINKIGISPLAEFEKEYGLDAEDLDRYISEFNKLSAGFLAEAQKDKVLGFTNLINLMRSIHIGEDKSHSCGAGIGMACVNADGKIYICHRLAEIEDFFIGDINCGIKTSKKQSLLEKGAVNDKGKCLNCWMKNLCGGGCHYENYHRGGLHCVPPESVCRSYCSLIDTCLKTYTILQEYNPALFSALMGEDPPGGHVGNHLV